MTSLQLEVSETSLPGLIRSADTRPLADKRSECPQVCHNTKQPLCRRTNLRERFTRFVR